MGNLNAKGNEKTLEKISLSPTSKKMSLQEPYLATAASQMLSDPRSPTVEYARTPIYRADVGAVVISQPEDVHQGCSVSLEPSFAVKTMSFDERDNEEFASECTVSHDVLMQTESGYKTPMKRNASSSQSASSSTASHRPARATSTRHVSITLQKHSLVTKSLKVLDPSISDAGDATVAPLFTQHSAHSIGLLASFRSPGTASSKYQRINNE